MDAKVSTAHSVPRRAPRTDAVRNRAMARVICTAVVSAWHTVMETGWCSQVLGRTGFTVSMRDFVWWRAHGGKRDQIRWSWQVSDEPKQSQDYEKDDEQHQAVPRSGLYFRAINPVKFQRRVPEPFQPLHQGVHPRAATAQQAFEMFH